MQQMENVHQHETPAREVAILTPAEVAREIACSRATVYRAIQRGELQAFRLGSHGSLRIPLSALTDFIRPGRVTA